MLQRQHFLNDTTVTMVRMMEILGYRMIAQTLYHLQQR